LNNGEIYGDERMVHRKREGNGSRQTVINFVENLARAKVSTKVVKNVCLKEGKKKRGRLSEGTEGEKTLYQLPRRPELPSGLRRDLKQLEVLQNKQACPEECS